MKPWSFKVDINGKPVTTVEHKGEERHFTFEETSAMVLSKMKETAEAYLGTPLLLARQETAQEHGSYHGGSIHQTMGQRFFVQGWYA